MKIGIKYCGGCNSRYDRAREIKKLIKQFPQHTFVYDTPDTKICDVWLIVCGCVSCCVATDNLIATKKKFILYLPRDFATVVAYLKQSEEIPQIQQKKLLHLGDTASMTKQFTTDDITNFAKLTGDYGKIHIDAEFAAHYGFGRPVIHGILTGSLISSVMAMQLPGDGTILMDENIRFILPVYPGDIITATVLLSTVKENKRFYVGELTGRCKNQKDEVVAEGTCHQMMMKNLFIIG
ncbi:MAG: MaoC family dehydratase [Megasphaera sp.]|jgi:acyl dehydratase|uniref:MaoC family dehydratase n=1 Tax=Megasphaera sueciensis TaxID=349094 RepID=UPI002ACB0E67|nr:MaoC family dehydratase [Megasphaera sp.]MCI1823920.1 MaoC family dehydratase [Megasphaera sp.]